MNAAENKNTSNKWLILTILAFNGIMVILDMSIVNISFPSLTRTFNTETTTVLWVSAAYNLISAAMMPFWGRIGDIYGRKRLIIIGFIIFAIGLVLCAVSQNITQLILARIIQAIGGSVHQALAMAIIVATFPEKERGKALGIMVGVVTAGPLIGPTLGGFLLDTMDWRAIFYVRVPFIIIGIILTLLFLKEQKASNTSSKIDWWGAVTLFGSLSGLTLFINLGGNMGFASAPVLLLAGATVIFLVLFIVRERKFKYPLVNLNLFKNRVFSAGNITLFLQNFTFSTITLLVPYLLIDGLGYSSLESGLLLTVPAIMMLFSPVSGWLSDRIGARPFCITGIVLIAAGLLLCSRLNVESSTIDVVLRLGILGLGNALFMSPNNSTILGAAPMDNLGTASALVSTIRTMAISSGMAFAGAIFASRQAWHTIQFTQANITPPSLLEKLSLIGGYQDALLVMAIICAFGILTAVGGVNKQPKHMKQ